MTEVENSHQNLLEQDFLFKDYDVSFSKESLLADINEKSPSGNDLRNSNSGYYQKYVEVKNLRNTLRKQELYDLQESGIVIKSEKWFPIVDKCSEFLSKETKDIEVLCWFNEGLTRIYGINGFIFGIDIFSTLVKKYSSNLYPHKEEGEDEEDRLFSISILNGQRDVGSLVIALYMAPLFFNKDDEKYNAWQIKKMLESDKLSGLDGSINNLTKSNNVKTFISTINKTKLLETKQLCDQACNIFNKFNVILSEVFSTSAPNIQNISKILSYIQNIVSGIAELLTDKTSPAESEDEKNEENAFKDTSNLNRQKAVRSLEQLSNFFQQSDPHSPATFLLKKSVKWFNEDLEQIMADILDEDERLKYCKITGVPFIRKPRGEEYED